MTNLVKIRYSHAYKCEYFLKTGQILPVFLEESINDLNPFQREILLDTIPIQDCIVNGANCFDFSNDIFSYEDKLGNIRTFTYEATSSQLQAEILLLVKELEKFKNEMSADFEKSQNEIESKIQFNRQKYLGNENECTKLEWYNEKFFDQETLDFIKKYQTKQCD